MALLIHWHKRPKSKPENNKELKFLKYQKRNGAKLIASHKV